MMGLKERERGEGQKEEETFLMLANDAK